MHEKGQRHRLKWENSLQPDHAHSPMKGLMSDLSLMRRPDAAMRIHATSHACGRVSLSAVRLAKVANYVITFKTFFHCCDPHSTLILPTARDFALRSRAGQRQWCAKRERRPRLLQPIRTGVVVRVSGRRSTGYVNNKTMHKPTSFKSNDR